MKSLFAVLAGLLLVFTVLPAQAALLASDKLVLEALYTSAHGDGWTHKENWLNGDPCTNNWYGITCDAANERVLEINLFMNNLNGTLPPTLNQLTAMTSFWVNDNSLDGYLPSLAGMSALKEFAVFDNGFTGVIPNLESLTALEHFDAEGNRLSGAIPPLSALTALRYFDVTDNQLTGPIPSLTGLNALEFFYASENQLNGPLPSLAGLPLLERFDVSENRITGPIPSLAGLPVLVELDVSENRITGPIPDLSALIALRYFYVEGNRLTGAPPAPPPALTNARLCPNHLRAPSADDVRWGAVTSGASWHQKCTEEPPSATVAPVPTLGEWALILLALLLGGLGLHRAQTRCS